MTRIFTTAAWLLFLVIMAAGLDRPANARQARDAQLGLARQVRHGLAAFNRHNYEAAATLLRPAAELGHPEAQSVLCYLYTYGRGVPQSYPDAAAWCVRAAIWRTITWRRS